MGASHRRPTTLTAHPHLEVRSRPWGSSPLIAHRGFALPAGYGPPGAALHGAVTSPGTASRDRGSESGGDSGGGGGGSGVGPGRARGRGCGAGCATAPPGCALPTVPRSGGWLGLASPFVCGALARRSAARAQQSLLEVPPPRPGPGRAFLLLLHSSLLPAPGRSSSHWVSSSPRPAAHPTLPGSGRSPSPLPRPVPFFISLPIPGLQGGENKLKTEQLRDSNKTPSS